MVIKRQAEDLVRLLLGMYPIVAVTGPRQSGKTTMLRTLFSDYQYVSLEDPDIRQFAKTDTRSFLLQYPERVIFDEAQRVPELFSYLQTIVDQSGMMGQFILSGSQNFHMMERITQSLAGRVALCILLPYDFSEMKQAGLLPDDFATAAVRGFYPALFDRSIPSNLFYQNYLRTYVERDITEMVGVKDMRSFRNFVSLCAARVGQLCNLNDLARDAGISQPTAKSWISLLESSYILFQLHPYFENFNKRIIKTPKLYFYDTGLVCHLLGINLAAQLHLHPMKGHIFENMVIAEVYKQNGHQLKDDSFFFWRDSNGNEVDLVQPVAGKLDVFEIIASATISDDMFRSLEKFDQTAGKRVGNKALVYGGRENQDRSRFLVRSWVNPLPNPGA